MGRRTRQAMGIVRISGAAGVSGRASLDAEKVRGSESRGLGVGGSRCGGRFRDGVLRCFSMEDTLRRERAWAHSWSPIGASVLRGIEVGA